MPEKLEEQIKPQELVDLFAFITLDKHPSDRVGPPVAGCQRSGPPHRHQPAAVRGSDRRSGPRLYHQQVGRGGCGITNRTHESLDRGQEPIPVNQNEPCVSVRVVRHSLRS